MKRVELVIQRSLIHWVATKFAGRHIKLVANLNEYARGYAGIGMDEGSPDLMLYERRDGRMEVFFLELKKKKGKLSDHQIEWNEAFDEHYKSPNCQRDVAYGFDQAKEKILEWAKL